MAEGCARGAGNDGGRVEDPGAQRGATSGAGDSQDCDLEGGNGLRLSLFNHQHLAEVYRNPQNRNLQLPKTIVKPHRSNLQLPKSIVSPHNRIRQLPKPIVNPHTSTLQLPKPIVNPHNCIRQLPGASVSLHTSTRQLPEASVSLPATSALLRTTPRSHRRRIFTPGRAAASIHRKVLPFPHPPTTSHQSYQLMELSELWPHPLHASASQKRSSS